MNGLFAYGTLLFGPVLRAVVGRDLPAMRAELFGFERRRLSGELFPAIVEAPGEAVAGLLYEGLDEDAWRRLDAFEGALYERRPVVVSLVLAGAPSTSSVSLAAPPAAGAVARAGPAPAPTRRAYTYVLSGSSRDRLGPEPWSPEAFERDHLAGLEARLRGVGGGGRRDASGPSWWRPPAGGDLT